MTCNNILTNLESAEESVRQALINSLTEKDDRNLTDMFSLLGNIQDVIGLFPHPHDQISFTTATGKDLDNLDGVIQFPTDYKGYEYDPVTDWENSDININTETGDVTTTPVGSYKSQEHRYEDPQ
tara:strand:+ start:289 stop:663 length:375 start_codon:yes stop_codon:yes gene_type:complete